MQPTNISRRTWAVRDAVPFVVSHGCSILLGSFDTAVAWAMARWWNVQLGRRAMFYGLPHFQKHPLGVIRIGEHCTFRSAEWANSIGINRRCFISASRGARVEIGDLCGFSGTIVSAMTSIRIGQRVLCGANCTICDADRHPLGPRERLCNEPGESAPIEIEDDVFLGMNVVVMKGVHIGKGTVVGANSVVTRSLPAGVVAAGSPARVVKLLGGRE